ncbi:glycosyl transferase family 2 [Haladaptatus sp. R4]|uniref:glycosyltransferase n=1 Tax=Haladaptatus sp. R4 TaxID=1679489 RepID=UPI0007B47B06|nr:glycosyltransferase [Haladaptatus sp. R4]KZN26243.1 glycosyl transferase family 2 [Haladaptatus sp. R4]
MIPRVVYLVLFVGVLGVGFERYRTRFERYELGAALLGAFVILVVAVAPQIGTLLRGVGAAELVAVLALVVTLGFAVLLRRRSVRTERKFNSLIRERAIRDVSDDPDENSIYVVIPAYNEAETVGAVVESLPESLFDHDIVPLVVSDGSMDGTARAARSAGALVVEHTVNTGQCGALKTGFEIARRRRADIVVGMDADGQHRGDEVERLVAPVLADEADYVIGSRYLGTDSSENGPVRRGGIWAFTTLINVLTKSSITDSTNGFRAVTIDTLDRISWVEERFCAVELLVEVRKNGFRLEEVPVTVERRQASTTKKPKLGYGIGIARTLVGSYLR